MEDNLGSKLADYNRRCNVDHGALTHIGYKRWDIVSKGVTETERDLWTCLFQAGNKKLSVEYSKSVLSCGEINYLNIRPDLVKNKIICEKNILKTVVIPIVSSKKIIIKKADKIRQENLIKKTNLELADVLKTMQLEPICSPHIAFSAKYEEFVLIKMMIQCKNLISKFRTNANAKQTEKKDFYSEKIMEMIIAYNKIIPDKKLNREISSTCISDLENWIVCAKESIEFDSGKVIINYPEYIFRTAYDSMGANRHIKLRASQQELFNFVTNNDKYLALVHTMLGSGKTSMILPLCAHVLSLKVPRTPIIYCCPNEVVMLEVARMAYTMAVSFAFVIKKHNENKIEYSWSNFADKKNPHKTVILYIADMFATRFLLEERENQIQEKKKYFSMNEFNPLHYPITLDRIPAVSDYILVCDEPTKDADSRINIPANLPIGFSIQTELFVDLMKISPPRIILMSATLPAKNQLAEFYSKIGSRYDGLVIESFVSAEARIGCALISSTGQLYMPHSNATTVREIDQILKVIQTNPFIGRFYTFEVLLEMVRTFKELGLDTPDLAKIFDDPSKATQINIQQIAYKMLEMLIATGTDEIITRTSGLKKNIMKKLDLGNIMTSDIDRFGSGCLIFSTDPIATAIGVYQQNFDTFVSASASRNIFQQIKLDDIMSQYKKETDMWQKSMDRITNKSDDSGRKNTRGKNNSEIVSAKSKLESKASLIENKPDWKFPKIFQIGTPEHLEKARVKTSQMTSIGSIGPSDLPADSSVSAEILTMLASGIGIYSTRDSKLDSDYLNTVLFLAKKGLIKFLFTDDSIAYGTNLSVSDIIMIDSDSTEQNSESIIYRHSVKTIFQMLGRAGRGSTLSFQARIYTTSDTNNLFQHIGQYVRGTLDEGSKDEVKNIQRAFEVLWK